MTDYFEQAETDRLLNHPYHMTREEGDAIQDAWDNDAALDIETTGVPMRVKVRDLRIGDVLMPTRRRVVGPYGVSRGVRTPPRKHDVDLQRIGRAPQRETYWSETAVTILRPSMVVHR